MAPFRSSQRGSPSRPRAFLEPARNVGLPIAPIRASSTCGIAPERVDSRTQDTGRFSHSATSAAVRRRSLQSTPLFVCRRTTSGNESSRDVLRGRVFRSRSCPRWESTAVPSPERAKGEGIKMSRGTDPPAARDLATRGRGKSNHRRRVDRGFDWPLAGAFVGGVVTLYAAIGYVVYLAVSALA